MRNRIILILILASIFCIPLSVVKSIYAAQKRAISYIPRDQELVIKSYDGDPYVLDESKCAALIDLSVKLARCNRCLELKDLCRDCCINMTAGARKTKCSDLKDSIKTQVFQPSDVSTATEREICQKVRDCVPAIGVNLGTTETTETVYTPDFNAFKDYCSSTNTEVPGCQNMGCPSDEPGDGSSTFKCVKSGDNWICNQDGIQDLKYPGCVPASKSGVDDCYTSYHGNFYTTINKLPPDTCKAYSALGGGSDCWEYIVNPDLINCMGRCNTGASDYERSFKAVDCCNHDKDVCCKADSGCTLGQASTDTATIRPGYQNNCANDQACKDRITWTECQPGKDTTPSFCCDNLGSADCIEISRQIDAIIKGKNFGCFSDISNKSGEEFKYEFVAKSNEKLMVIWQVQTSPEYCEADPDNLDACKDPPSSPAIEPPNTYFYTLIKIFDLSNGGQEIYPAPYADSVMNQKSFTAAFSVFAAIATGMDNSSPPKSIFQQGHRYQVKLYYLIAPLSKYVLRSTISKLQFIILRVRE
ncbi:MAG: hypothetical protein WC417_07375 [Candidatus Omnitrophota bacterium]